MCNIKIDKSRQSIDRILHIVDGAIIMVSIRCDFAQFAVRILLLRYRESIIIICVTWNLMLFNHKFNVNMKFSVLQKKKTNKNDLQMGVWKMTHLFLANDSHCIRCDSFFYLHQ